MGGSDQLINHAPAVLSDALHGERRALYGDALQAKNTGFFPPSSTACFSGESVNIMNFSGWGTGGELVAEYGEDRRWVHSHRGSIVLLLAHFLFCAVFLSQRH